eukprot:gene3825-3338_t
MDLSDAEFDALWRELDADGSGSVSLHEFVRGERFFQKRGC